MYLNKSRVSNPHNQFKKNSGTWALSFHNNQLSYASHSDNSKRNNLTYLAHSPGTSQPSRTRCPSPTTKGTTPSVGSASPPSTWEGGNAFWTQYLNYIKLAGLCCKLLKHPFSNFASRNMLKKKTKKTHTTAALDVCLHIQSALLPTSAEGSHLSLSFSQRTA